MNELPPVVSLNSNTISDNDINLFHESKEYFSIGTLDRDLHGYSVEDAQYDVKRTIQSFYYTQYCKTILFITGRGKHVNTKGERGTLFKLFPQWLRDENVSDMIEECEPQIGAYKVTLKKITMEYVLAMKFERLYLLAEIGLPNYQFYLGVKYHTGNGIKKDDEEAAKWFRKAAEQDLSPAQLMLGFLYMMDMGVQRDVQQGLHWYHLAARQNNSTAMKNIAYHLLTEKDYKNAKEWFCKAYEAGNAESANQIGIMYSFGIGTLRDPQKAEEWYRKAAEAGDNHGKVNLGTQLLENNYREGIRWIIEAAIEGLADAQLHLGEAYLSQDAVYEGKKWLLKSALQNAGKPSGHAQFILGIFTDDSKQKLEWYQKAADNDVKLAQKELAKMYRGGYYGLKKDKAKAIKLYNAAAKPTVHYGYDEKGNQYAQYSLGECYELGLLKVKKNPKTALKWYKEAAKQGYMLALARLGIIQENDLTLTEIQERLKGIRKLPTSKELENVDILIFLGVYSHSTKYYTLKRKTDKLNNDDEIYGHVFFKCIMSVLLHSETVETSTLNYQLNNICRYCGSCLICGSNQRATMSTKSQPVKSQLVMSQPVKSQPVVSQLVMSQSVETSTFFSRTGYLDTDAMGIKVPV
ncbi:17150_t:CDS:2 [Acaulospora morrowiae]|uniref:17150_t:CDS:1 n=1 Tax=Acaulospora morrowiae TaxID=94023 RepID=A0A9N8YQ05_9GLOM|nr:17150_t:CDS:2 [Acaulospora morrowiae]